MDTRQRITALFLAGIVFAVVFDLVRRKKLTEEFSWIWLLASVTIVSIAVWNRLFLVINRITGIVSPTSISFFFGIAFLILINLHLSLKISRASEQLKNLAQKLSLHDLKMKTMETELEEFKEGKQIQKSE